MNPGAPVAPAVRDRIAQFNKLYGGQNEEEGDHLNTEPESSEDGASRGRLMFAADSSGQAMPVQMGQYFYDRVQPADQYTESSSNTKTNDKVVSPALPAHKVPVKAVKGMEAELVEEEEEEGGDDQFMRITAAATSVKPVEKVKKDKYHNKPDKKRSNGMGLTRMLSSVKRPDLGQSRPSLGAVGRMLSMSKEKKNPASTPLSAASLNAMTSPVSTGSDMAQNSPGPSDASPGSARDRPRDVQQSPFPSKKKSTLTRTFSMAHKNTNLAQEDGRSKSVNLGDRSRSTTNNSSRLSLGHVGRMLSFSRTRSHAPEPNATDEVDPISDVSSAGSLLDGGTPRRDTQSDLKRRPSRMTLKNVGRLLSKSRANNTTSPSAANNTPVVLQPSPPHTDANRKDGPQQATNSPGVLQDRSGASRAQGPSVERAESTARGKSLARGASFAQVGRLLSSTRKRQSPALAEAKAQDAGTVTKKAPPTFTGPTQLQYFFTPLNSQAMRDSGGLSEQTHLRIPVLHMSAYSGPVSKTNWHIDAITLAQNAFRRELVDLYTILAAVGRSTDKSDTGTNDVLNFQKWWNVASIFFQTYFMMETKVMFPWLEKAVSKNSDQQTLLSNLMTENNVLLQGFEHIDEILGEAGSMSPGQIFGKTYSAMDELVKRIAEYFREQEQKLPDIIQQKYTLDDRLKMDKDFLAVFIGEPLGRKSKDAPRFNVVLLVRWIQNPRQVRAWVARNLNTTAKNLYPKWKQVFDDNHRSIVNSFQARDKL
eukprot:Plantae.Rhodophyta-Hildenbrandia_rubra.ctg2738.p1 GENE.Plantae.Rhodophyta-Hildenbrandia_rubra.ctg2738~~Plantae.Rhodophyta-Hildenbrandia_rubra.ctg2738.p1  ORF type:complete len:762 (+),score=127.32 Plantae.Rhodophyta-Hildenbrandia_rubra.ctg2738:3626-5911(+)